jgi:hypothetical protein
MTDYDTPWKDLLNDYLEDFMAFFFPDAWADIDWSRGYESLDKELSQIVRDAELGKRLADKVVKVWRRSGQLQIILIHIEIQGDPEDDFSERIYVYNYRLFDCYHQRVVSFAVLTDTRRTWRPDRFVLELWGCRTGIEFPIVKLYDYRARIGELEQSDNIFATVVLAHLESQRHRKKLENRLRVKLHLLRRLYERGYTRNQILDLFRFLDWILVLPDELEQQLQVELDRLEGERNMPYVSRFELKAIEKGRQQGWQEGRQEGRQEGEALLLQKQLTHRFGPLPTWVEQRLHQANTQELELWAERVLEAGTLQGIFQ